MKRTLNGGRGILAVLMAATAISRAEPAKLEEVASFGKNQPIGMAVASEPNRVFVSFPYKEPFLYGLTEIVGGERKPFPDDEWNRRVTEKPDTHFVNVQDLFVDKANHLWVLDSAPGAAASIFGKEGGREGGYFKLVRIDLAKNEVAKVYDFPDLPKDKSAINDVCVDLGHGLAYLSDPGLKAIVVLDLESGKSRIALKEHPSTLADPDFKLHLDGKDVVDGDGKPFSSNVNGIALTKDEKYFYYRAINQTKLYRIPTQHLADASLSDVELGKHVEMVAETGVCHGMVADAKGNVFVTASADKAIKYVTPEGKVHTLVTDDRLIWPDSMGVGSDGYLYLTCAQINRAPKYHGGEDKVEYPFRAFRVKLP
ncbi:major royal jelly family protein [Luteolibacter flavescens]|uniref:Major royal jelly family protein n=1 Tax=Luteolibacter flavescens TaxID=1859460 RepID=A0ABT3FL57_9BACT|nr:major royal jelly family protein [Luteolibacter flavescens]MCW1884307.1 major royal jelly family protein [Luteolibacter flavescens]